MTRNWWFSQKHEPARFVYISEAYKGNTMLISVPHLQRSGFKMRNSGVSVDKHRQKMEVRKKFVSGCIEMLKLFNLYGNFFL